MLDEPLSALDPAMRSQLQDELKRLHRAFGTTTFLVSHDATEILRLSDSIVRLENGKVVSDGDGASAFASDGKGLLAHYVSGPDEDGFSAVSIDGRLCRIRYRNAPQDISAGDLVMLDIGDASVSLADQAGPMRTFTSRGGAR